MNSLINDLQCIVYNFYTMNKMAAKFEKKNQKKKKYVVDIEVVYEYCEVHYKALHKPHLIAFKMQFRLAKRHL